MKNTLRQRVPYFLLLPLVWLVGLAAANAAVTVKDEAIDGKPAFRLENYRVSLLILPAQGGAVVSYKDKLGGNVELIPPGAHNGLCMDHFQCQPWPGELLDTPYDGKILKSADGECVVQVSCEVKGDFRGSQYPKLKGLRLEKSYTLRDGSPALETRVKLTAPVKNSTLVDYWLQNVFFAGGKFDFDCDTSFRPTVRGVRVKTDRKTGFTGPEDFLRDFNDGWLALLDTKTKSGLVVLTDYNDLRFLYVCGSSRTLEPMFEMAYLPAGASREYTVYIVPVAGLDNIVAATPDYIAGYRMESDNKGAGKVEFNVVRSMRLVTNLALNVTIGTADKPSPGVSAGTLAFDKIGDEPQARSATFTGAGPDPLILQVVAKATGTGEAVTNRFEDYFNGAYQWGENIQTDMASPRYKGVRPPQQLRLNKPKEIRIPRPWEMQMWYAEGLLDDYYGVTQALRLTMRNNGKTKWTRAFVSSSIFGTKLSSFPYDYEELFSYDYIVLGGLRQDALGGLVLEMLTDFVNAGGGLVVLGGPMAYAKSDLAGTKFADLWPVKILPGDYDLLDLQGAPIEVADASVPFLMDLDWKPRPTVRYLHNVELKPGAKVVLTAGGKPFLVTGEAGPHKARIICILGAAMGTLPAGQTPFWEWSDWRYLMRQVFWWTQRYYDFDRFGVR
ncbi:MAG: glutamine amidotransferase [Kiritimatiellae bacterium]|nr:hypothetical protein [Verrucomicrobiota bacterium]MBU4366965.1 hypothetical protein [Verrucomicrobiota bacterium]MCG2659432.1 glutamine amidotransferase [Kiritimatiellia bacterium]